MNFETAFYVLVAFLVGYIFAKGTPFYIGYNEDKYNKANLGILLRK